MVRMCLNPPKTWWPLRPWVKWPQAGASFTGLLTALYGLGQIAGPPMVAALLARAPSQAQGFEWGLSLAASALLLGLLMFVWMVWRWPNGATK